MIISKFSIDYNIFLRATLELATQCHSYSLTHSLMQLELAVVMVQLDRRRSKRTIPIDGCVMDRQIVVHISSSSISIGSMHVHDLDHSLDDEYGRYCSRLPSPGSPRHGSR